MSYDSVIIRAPATATTSGTQGSTASRTAGTAQLDPAQTPDVRELPTRETIEAVAQRIESYLKSVHRSLEFRVDSASGRTVLTVRDSATGELIRQIPGEEVLRLAEMADEQTIVLMNETA